MPEEIEVETRELQETLEELHKEREERQQEEHRSSWTRYIALNTALMAVVAAVAALLSGSLVNEALIERQNAGIEQARASDAYAYFQAKGIKSVVSGAIADALSEMGKSGKTVAGLRTDQVRYLQKQAASLKEGKAHETARDEAIRKSERLLAQHHTFAYAVTLTQVAIALSAIAALTKRRNVWYLSLAVGVAGLVLFLYGFRTPPGAPAEIAAGEAPAAAAPG